MEYIHGPFRLEKGIERESASLHMVFSGNLGTAKTTVARLFAEIMKDEKVLSTGAFYRNMLHHATHNLIIMLKGRAQAPASQIFPGGQSPS